jgi:hypothetical protein
MNPLQKYFRQPKLYMALPSHGNYYEPGALDGDPSKVPVFAMTGMDEIIMKTPDALFNGEATIKLIESCCPYIKNAKSIPGIDVDTILASIRIATFGGSLPITTTCTACGTENEYDVDLHSVVEYYSKQKYDNKLSLSDTLIVYFKPLSYHESSVFNIEHFSLQQLLGQLANITDLEERQRKLDTIYSKIADIEVKNFLNSIESVKSEDTSVTDREHIREWLANCDLVYYEMVKNHLKNIKKTWTMPKYDVVCEHCGAKDSTDIILDQSHFFG